MPLPENERRRVLDYCSRHIEPTNWFTEQIEFVQDEKLKNEMNLAFYSARYMEKLGEALAVSEDRRHPHLKFQIVQYASIYEAVIVYLLFGRYINHEWVNKIRADQEYAKIADVPKEIVHKDGKTVTYCVRRQVMKDPIHVRFEDKLRAAREIGFLLPNHQAEILSLYKTRNAVHLESAVRNSVIYEAKQAMVAYKRLRPFLAHVRQHLATEDKGSDLPT